MRTKKICLMISISVLVFLTLLAGLLPGKPAAAAPRELTKPRQLLAVSLYLQTEPTCLGDDENIPVFANDPRGFPLKGAVFTMDGKQVGKTDARGGLVATYHPKEEGTSTVTFTASMAGYTSATFQVQVQAKRCTWTLRMDYNESNTDPGGNLFFEGSMEINDTELVSDDNGNLSLVSGSNIMADYHVNLYDTIIPFDYQFTPPIEGQASVQFSGSYKNHVVYITLTSSAIDLPRIVTLQLYDRIRPDTKIPPQTFYTYTSADIINRAQIVNKQFAADHTYYKFKFDKGVFWKNLKTEFASGVLVVEQPPTK